MVYEDGSESPENRLKFLDSGRHFDIQMPTPRSGARARNLAVFAQCDYEEVLDVVPIDVARQRPWANDLYKHERDRNGYRGWPSTTSTAH
ncbi:hypothetical protein [Actinoplanes octamycinicus]|uniref:hypothetical protein n=1 Tax=Actinoplanes octamycinicus TaxID=135948 RepID=UPI001942D076|nr:hypothetical protein [Actinoplanes octamycinicus]GIE61281.1 hypothetical protein Aoc01nite_66830 [Actinoplanes octamycinicus]